MWSVARSSLCNGLTVKATMKSGCTLARVQLFASRVRSVAPEARTARRRTLKEIVMAPAGESAFNLGKGALAGASAIGLGALCFYGLGMSKGIGAIDRSMHRHGARQFLHTAGTALVASNTPNGEDLNGNSQDPSKNEEGIRRGEDNAGATRDTVGDDVRQQILRAALEHVHQHGFSPDAVCAGARSLGLAPTVHGLFERGAGAELALFFYRDCNARFAATVATAQQQQKNGTGKALRDAVIARLRMTALYVDEWPSAMALLASSPSIAQDALMCLVDFVDEAWHAAGDVSADMSWYTKRAELAVIYKASELYMLQDTSDDFANTWAFVDRLFADVASAASTLVAVQAAASGVGSGAYTAVSLAKNVLGLQR